MNANWQAIGKMDALNGEYLFPKREESCKKHGLGADQSAYDRGVQEGLIGFFHRSIRSPSWARP